MNTKKLTSIKNALTEHFACNQQIHLNDASQICNHLLEMYEMCKLIARTNRDQFTFKTHPNTSELTFVSTALADKFVSFISQFNQKLLTDIFNKHTFHPFINLFMTNINRFRLWPFPFYDKMTLTTTANQFFNQIRIDAHKPEFINECEKWENGYVQNAILFDQLTLPLLKQLNQLYITRLEFYHNDFIPFEHVERSWEHLQSVLANYIRENNIIYGIWSLSHNAVCGYCYSLIILSETQMGSDLIYQVMSQWQRITSNHGICQWMQNTNLPYRGRATGLIEYGDIYKKDELRDANIFMTQSDYLVKLPQRRNGILEVIYDEKHFDDTIYHKPRLDFI